jgi:hypothetical protein
VDNQNIYAVRCDACNGLGSTNNYFCQKCDGTGRIPVLDGEQWATDRMRADVRIANWLNGFIFALVFAFVLWGAIELVFKIARHK